MTRGNERILIVDDDPGIRSMLRQAIGEAGYGAVEAEDGQKALEYLQEDKNISVIVLDIRLPVLSGMEVYEIIKRKFPRKKIIISSVCRESEQEFLIWDADGYYYKGDTISGLLAQIDAIISSAADGIDWDAAGVENEKRKARRFPVKIITHCAIPSLRGSAKSYRISFTRDVSVSGLRLVSAECLQAGDSISMILELPNCFIPIVAEGKVIWAQSSTIANREGAFCNEHPVANAGVTYTRMDVRDRNKLEEFLSIKSYEHCYDQSCVED